MKRKGTKAQSSRGPQPKKDRNAGTPEKLAEKTRNSTCAAQSKKTASKPDGGTGDGSGPAAGDGGVEPKCRVLKGHKGEVLAVAVTPDGRYGVSCSREKTGRQVVDPARRRKAVLRTLSARSAVSGSFDNTLKVWDLASGTELRTLSGHSDLVLAVAVTPDGRCAVSGSFDNTLKVWDLSSGAELRTLSGHSDLVSAVAVTPDGRYAVSGSVDRTLKVWDLASGAELRTLSGHSGTVTAVGVTPDGRHAVSGSQDRTLKVWDLASGECKATFEGHTRYVLAVALTPDGRRVISGSLDRTVRLWDLASGTCIETFKGHKNWVWAVAVTPDGRHVVSGSADNTLRIWDLPEPAALAAAPPATRYMNAKVVLAGDTGVGKTGLAIRLVEDRWEPTESTHGMQVSQLTLAQAADPMGTDRELWLWDFAGQPDYRLIHQLYMDETAVGVVVFDPQDDNPFESLAHWDKALRAAVKHKPAKLLVAGRCDRGGITITKAKFERFCGEHEFVEFLDTSAKTGEGCETLKAAIAEHIPWDRLPWTATTKLFKTLKDAIIELKEKSTVLLRLPELRERLQLMLPEETIPQDDLRAVVGLLQGQGLIAMLAFGDFVLLKPEQINQYASVVVRSAREHAEEMGSVAERDVLEARLDFKGMKRLAKDDEAILLRAMTQTFIERSLCIREDTPVGPLLVFPSYFNRERPDMPEHPNVFVTYGLEGQLDEIYSTLVVRLNYTDGLDTDELWKNAADFKTPQGKRVGLAMAKKAESTAEIVVYFEPGVPDDTKVTFIKYVHEHLLKRAEEVTRVRTYVCPHCDTPVENRKAIRIRLDKGLRDIVCAACEERVPLIDLIEEKFASSEFLQRVRKMDEQAQINIDNESRELILVGHAYAIAGEAGQIFRRISESDWGIDGEIEFKDRRGRASGQRVYLQLKHGDSYLYKRQRDEKEIFTIKNPRHADYWQQQPCPVMLVIRTSDGQIRWMNVTAYLKEKSKGRKTPVKQIAFEGEPFTAQNLLKMRDRLIPRGK